MVRRGLALALLLVLALPARAEEPPSLPACTTVEQVEALMLYPVDGQPVEVEPGYIRYVSQDTWNDPNFCAEYWYGGEPGGELDLTIEKTLGGTPYAYYARNMCTRAIYSMALSYLGIDMTPGGMSAMTGNRVVKAPYDETTNMVPGLEQVRYPALILADMFEAYQADSSYSPVYLRFKRKNGSTHAVLVVGKREDGRYIVIDPKYRELDGEPVHVYTIHLNGYGQLINGSDFYNEQQGSRVLGCYQWRLVDAEEP